MSIPMRFIIPLFVVLLVWMEGAPCASADGDPPLPTSVAAPPVYQHAVVAADHPLASQAGVEILQQGGNVVDAAVATAFALAVVRPASCGLGGGGFMLIWDARKKKAVAIDYREQAPLQATENMFVDPSDRTRAREEASRYGGLAIAVPAHVAGLCLALREFGTLELPAVIAPALRLCREGFVVDPHDREVQREILDEFRQHPEFQRRFATLHRLYLNGGKPWPPEAKFQSPLREVLEKVTAEGASGFYQGPVAQALVTEIQRQGGRMTLEDLAAVRPKLREPLSDSLEEWQLLTMPPPSSGGVALLQTLRLYAAFEPGPGRRDPRGLLLNSPGSLHLLAESFQHAFADRAEFLGDADFADVPVKRLLGAPHLAAMASRIDRTQAQPQETYGRFRTPDDGGTSHFSIIDAAGNAVACTETINTAFGSLVVEPQFGVLLNNEMDDFTAHPDLPNAFGLRQSAANAIAPLKRPLSSMTPTILVRDGQAQFALGASGGPRIITATTQVLLHLTRDRMTPAAAVSAPRIHHQWFPHRLELERGFDQELARDLSVFGHIVRWADDSAVVQAVSRGPDGLRGASDRRKHGRAAGY
ncbi:MAG: gamma-glutamyltransferase [Planctomycetales bacterium]